MAASEAPFTGVGVALVTLFTADGAVDTAATAEHAARLVQAGLQAVLISGTTGEAAALDRAERIALLDAVVAALRPLDATVIAGTGAVTGSEAALYTADAAAHGADVALALSPPWANDPRPYYDTVAKAAGELPLMAYHYPAASRPGIPVDRLPDLPVVGCKDSSGDGDRLLETLTVWHGHLYLGSSAVIASASQLGLPGVILALANAEPELCVRAFDGDGGAQRALAGAHTAMRAGGFPAGIKGLTAARWGTSPVSRMGT